MTTRLAAILTVTFLLAGSAKAAEVDKGKAPFSEDEETMQAPSAKRKNAVQSYLKTRINQLDRMHKAQQDFGRKISSAWAGFWAKTYEDRKLFEVRVARQRLNMFESLSSLHPTAHPQTMADYDKLQNDVIRSFESSQKARMEDFFTRLMAELKQFAVEQEKIRADFTNQAMQAWRDQQKNPTLVPR